MKKVKKSLFSKENKARGPPLSINRSENVELESDSPFGFIGLEDGTNDITSCLKSFAYSSRSGQQVESAADDAGRGVWAGQAGQGLRGVLPVPQPQDAHHGMAHLLHHRHRLYVHFLFFSKMEFCFSQLGSGLSIVMIFIEPTLAAFAILYSCGNLIAIMAYVRLSY
jgi:hypothetical protein